MGWCMRVPCLKHVLVYDGFYPEDRNFALTMAFNSCTGHRWSQFALGIAIVLREIKNHALSMFWTGGGGGKQDLFLYS